MTFKNQRTTYFRLRALTTHANKPQVARGYWIKVHQIYTERQRDAEGVNGWGTVTNGVWEAS